jgi:hypothetical protein
MLWYEFFFIAVVFAGVYAVARSRGLLKMKHKHGNTKMSTRDDHNAFNLTSIYSRIRRSWLQRVPQTPLASDIPRMAAFIEVRLNGAVMLPVQSAGDTASSKVDRTFLVLCALAETLERAPATSEAAMLGSGGGGGSGGMKESAKVKARFYEFVAPDSVEMTAGFAAFLAEVLGERSELLSLLKLCTQDAVIPAAIALTMALAPVEHFRNSGDSWRIVVDVKSRERAVVTHEKEEESVKGRDTADGDVSVVRVRWRLRIHLDHPPSRLVTRTSSTQPHVVVQPPTLGDIAFHVVDVVADSGGALIGDRSRIRRVETALAPILHRDSPRRPMTHASTTTSTSSDVAIAITADD